MYVWWFLTVLTYSCWMNMMIKIYRKTSVLVCFVGHGLFDYDKSERVNTHFGWAQSQLWESWTGTQSWTLRCNTPRSRWCRCPRCAPGRSGLWTPRLAQSHRPRWSPGWAGPGPHQPGQGWTSLVCSHTPLLFPGPYAPLYCLDWMVEIKLCICIFLYFKMKTSSASFTFDMTGCFLCLRGNYSRSPSNKVTWA